jgi:hypothetical protein
MTRLDRAHIRRYGTTPDGRIFQTARRDHTGLRLQRCLAEARKKTLTLAQCRSPLGRRPYDLRHAAVSLWLNSGVPAAVLLKIYAHCIDGQADAANQRITDALGTTEPGPGDEDDADSEPEAWSGRSEAGTVRDGQRNRSYPRRPCPVRGFQGPRNPGSTDA